LLAGRKLAVSFHVAGESGPMTWHAKALQTSYATAPAPGPRATRRARRRSPSARRPGSSWTRSTSWRPRARRWCGARRLHHRRHGLDHERRRPLARRARAPAPRGPRQPGRRW
jgi:hypothetical protein